ncbi:MAG TPA: NADP-dependent oxidoreductase [Polyangiaceae bacterium]|nr:NADP-dependent oxidoreductase [Polyangiaceae bacterium]
MPSNTRVLLAARPDGWPTDATFRVDEAPIPTPRDGEFVVRLLWLSLDPYMRGRISAAKSYAKGVEIGDVMTGSGVGQVVDSKHPAFAAGDTVIGQFGWQEWAASDGAGVMKVPPGPLPLSVYLGTVGMPGVTAYVGLLDIGAPKAGETVLVSAAAGAVGGVVGQLAKIQGCRAVGIAGGREKCDYVVRELGFDACVDYKSGGDLDKELRAAAPKGVDVLFENVGGPIMDTAFRHLNPFARVPLCGLVSQYNETVPYAVASFGLLLVNRVKLQGFIVSDDMSKWPGALAKLSGWVAEGRIKGRETIAKGIRSAPAAFVGMLRGGNIGKQLVKVAEA